jgi:hypothetical protein
MQPALKEEEESPVRMFIQLLVKDLLAEIDVAVHNVADEEGHHEVVAEQDDTGQKLTETVFALINVTDFADA